MSKYHEIESRAARRFCEALFLSYGFSKNESAVISDVLLSADFAGIDSHGVQRIVRYDYEIKSGCVDARARRKTLMEGPVSALIDARKAMGQLAGVQAMTMASAKAHKNGFGIVTVRNSNHIGISGYYSELAAKEGLLGICMTNTEAIAVPTFGKKGMIGTNSIAVAMSTADGAPFSFDISTSVVPRGKIEVYEKNGEELPPGWAVDDKGRETRDAREVIQNIINKNCGGILPLGGEGITRGGHKGFGLGIIVDIFTGIFSGGLTSNHINLTPGFTGICNCFMALDYGIFGDKSAIEKSLAVFLREIRNSPQADGAERIRTPGERKAESCAKRRDGTIPVNEPTLNELAEIGRARGLPEEVLLKAPVCAKM